MTSIQRDQETKRLKAIYRDCYTLHAAKLAELGTVDPGTFWNDFFVQMKQIEAQHPDDALTCAFLVAIHADLEALEKQITTDTKGDEEHNEV